MKSRSIGIVMAVITVMVMLGHVTPASAAVQGCDNTWRAVGAAPWTRTSGFVLISGGKEQIQFKSMMVTDYKRQIRSGGRCATQSAHVGTATHFRRCDSRWSCLHGPWQRYNLAQLVSCGRSPAAIQPRVAIHACNPVDGRTIRIPLMGL